MCIYTHIRGWQSTVEKVLLGKVFMRGSYIYIYIYICVDNLTVL